jgi:hypothetical protein
MISVPTATGSPGTATSAVTGATLMAVAAAGFIGYALLGRVYPDARDRAAGQIGRAAVSMYAPRASWSDQARGDRKEKRDRGEQDRRVAAGR